eukprot:gnl/Trimastix_PCT/2793.p1 GENE.gnl/Trimastix_PCT/2793~~gnl/Trimastix_PCT/2793.p1  ORF type:complete len:153 (+),score=19.43 gnl/Trimastix_PCT/2793:118-576(+)
MISLHSFGKSQSMQSTMGSHSSSITAPQPLNDSQKAELTAQLRQIYDAYDDNGDGVLQRDEALRFFTDAYGIALSVGEKAIKQILKEMDKVGIPAEVRRRSKEQSKKMIAQLRADFPRQAQQLFDRYDVNHDGVLEWEEFLQVDTTTMAPTM